jgi:hypothetical protein
VHRLVGDLLDIACCGLKKLVTQVRQRTGHSQLIPNLGHIPIRRVEPGKTHADQARLIAMVEPCQRSRPALVLVNLDLDVPTLACHHVVLLISPR